MSVAGTMDLGSLLAELKRRDIRLWREGDALRFDAPEGGFPAELKALVKVHRAEILEHLAAELPAPPDPIPVRGETEGRLSFAQERLWFLQQLDPGDPAYHIPVALRLDGALDPVALNSAISVVTARHGILRTEYFADPDGVPRQRMLPARPVTLPVLDLSALPPTLRDREAERVATATVREPFSLGRTSSSGASGSGAPGSGAPIRWRLVRLAADRHRLILVLHHLSGDGWSLGLLLQQVAVAYASQRTRQAFGTSVGGARDSAPQGPSYLDVAAWQRQRWEDGDLDADVAFWHSTLEGLPDLELPLPEVDGGQPSGRLRLSWFEDRAAGVEALARRVEATPFAVVVAAWQAVLGRITGQQDFALGTPVAGRTQLELEGIVGLLINSLVLRAQLAAAPEGHSPGLAELASRVHRASIAAQEHQELPFERLVSSLEAERGSRRTPLFQVLVAQQPPMPPIRLPRLEMTPLPLWSGAAQMDLLLAFGRTREGFEGYLEYRGERVDPTAAGRWLRSLGTLVQAGLEAPERGWQDLPLLAPAELHQLTVEAGALATPPRALEESDSLWRRFALRCAAAPEAIAVSWEGTTLTYGQLQRRSLRLAARLRGAGVARGDRVGLLLDRSPAMVASILATVAVGAAYVPMDPAYPATRLEFLVQDARPAVLVTEATASSSDLPTAAREVPRLAVAVGGQSVEDSAGGPPQHLEAELPLTAAGKVGADDLAYLIYTSGSTGRPKGVAVAHGQVLRLFDASLDERAFGPSGLGAADVWSVFHSFSFDFSVWEMWGALLLGGRMVLVPRAAARSPQRFLELLEREGVTVLSQTPSAFRSLQGFLESSSEVGVSALPDLAWVVFGGEALDPRALRPWVSRHGVQRPALINMYGITETTVHVTFHRLGAADLEEGRSLVGRPLADLTVFLLDPRQRPLPLGATGEICVGGSGVTRGYFGRPGLTAERFVPDPFSGIPGARLYRSGDLARRRRDGVLETLGRADEQVKIRGHRIEPGEVEAALLALPEIAQTAVIAAPTEGGESRLVAYYVAAATEEPSAEDLLAQLAVDLPPFMVPSLLIALEELPLTAHGKLDRRALPAPSADQVERRAFRPPQSVTERRLAEIWNQVLGVESIGLDDSFFALGGDSILTLRVQALAQRQGLVLNLEDVFRYPTLGEIAAALDLREAEGQVNGGDESVGGDAGAPRPFALLDAAESESIHALHGGRIEDAYAATRLQQGMLFHGELDPTQGIYHDVFSHHLAGPWSLAALEAAAQELARRHPALRTAFELAALRRPLALVSRRAEVGITVVDLRRLDGETQESVIRARLEGEQQRPFVVDRGPLWRLDVAHRGEHRWQLTLSFHHAILDGWSVASLSRELMELYLASLDDSSFPELPPDDSPRRYAAAEVAALENPEVAEHWRRYLASAPLSPMSLPLPLPLAAAEVDRVDEESVPGMAEIPVVVEAQAGSQLQAAAQRLGLPLKSLLLAIHLRVLETATGRRQPWTGLIVHARPGGPAAERSLGLFLNTLPLRSSGPRGDWVSRAQAAFAAEAELQPFRRYPLAEMRQQAGGGELFDTAFNYVHFHIFEGLAQGNRLQVLGGQFLERTDLPLLAHFYRTPEGEGLALTLKADLSRVPQPRLEEIAELYRRAVADAASALGEAPSLEKASSAKKRSEPAAVATLLTVDELRQRLEPGIGAPAAAAPCVDELVAAAVEKSPQAPAVEGPEGELSYRELWWRSGAVARRLRDLGVGPEVPVGLYLGRTAEALVTLLGVLRCGGVALPLDPALPQRRLAAMVRDSGTLVVVADRPPEGILEPETMALSIEEFRGEAPPSDPFADEAPERDPRNPVYLLYTSGSTGKPKAVTLSHGVLAGLLRWQRGSLGDSARTAWFSALGFDVSFEEIFSTWERGGTLVLVGEEERQDPRALLHHLAKYRVERLFLPYVALRELAVAAEGLPAQELPGSLVDLVSAGEQVYVDPAVVALCSGTPPRRLHNHYGPTESHVVSAAQFTGDPARWPPRAPVGGPIAGSRLVVLDEHLEPVAPGAVGELYIGGDVLARCYHRRPGLTAERFLPDPFAGHWGMPVGSRLYRTGDRARWLPVDQLKGQSPQGQQGEGQQLAGYQLAVYQLHILGRLDDQLKVRGHRVESGEVERTLAAHPAVSAAAIAIHGSGSVARLVAYVVLRAEAQASPRQELSPWLAERLPAAMVPDSWVILDALPRTASGKLNRRALPAPAAPSEGEPRVEGRAASGLAVAVAAIFAEVLEVPAVSVDASFFEIGGHSLSAARALARLRRRFDAELPLRLLFEHPSAADLARQLARRQPAAGPLLVRREGEELPPLSFPQERLWLLQQLEPASAAYNLPVPLLLAADAQLGTWRRALENLVARHQTLRSLVVEGPEGARARILPPGTLSLPVVDLWSVPTESRQEVAAGIGRRLASLPFDLAAEPALRATWLDLGELGKALVLVFHHAACDGWSLGVVARELSTEVVGDAAAPPELEIEYGDYAAWQREREAAGALEVSLDWWRQQLAGVPPVLTLPLDRPRSGAGSGAGSAADWVPLSLEIETGASIEALARQQGTTRFAVLLAAYQLLLGRFGGDRRVVVGTPEAGRSLPELEPLVGCFVNTLALSADLGTGGFGDLVNQVGKTVVDALCNAEVPFERLVAELVADRHRDHSPLVQVSFTLDPPGIGGQGEGLFELLSAGAVSARFDLELSLSKAQDGSLFGGLAYRCDLLDRATAERLGASFTRLLGAALGAPKRGLWELELLSPVEQEELIAASVTASPADSCWSLGGRMESTWATHGSQDALLWSGGRWSHQRLGAEVRARVDELHRRGVGPETVVGLDLPRSPELMAWMLAVVAAGGAYLPLTPEHPRPRRAALLADAGACWLVAKAEAWQEGEMDAIPDGIERLRPKVGELDLARAYTPLPLVAPEALAYVLYTSGSTGRPKGVMVSRQGLGRYLARAAAAYGPGGTWLLHTPVIYDLAITGLWLPLLSGGRVVLAPEPLPASGLGPLVPAGEERPRVKLTPSQARLLGETLLEPAETRELPWELVLGGEALSPSDVAWLAPGSRVHDEYGPTEAVVGSTVSSSTASSSAVSSSTVSSSTRLSDGEDGALEDITLDASTLDEGGQVVGSAGIGNSMPGCSAWLVDEALVRLPLGVPGELALGGGGLARGYLGQPRETAERFVPDPYSGGAGDRLYRTGDRARLRAGSEGRWRLEYLGREDSQLKVRGIRVEPAEVEASLASLASVRVAAVDGRRAGSGPIALTAWVVPAAPRPVEDVELFAKSLRQELGERLPEAMVPARVVVLDRLPTTAAGKVDRRSLPEPSAPAGAGVGRPPRQGTEESVARLWAELLGLEELPPAEEDFFALGGHSLVASRLVARLRRDYELEVPLSTVFSSPRLETFAAAVDELRGTPPLPPIQRLPDDERRGPSPLSFTQERMWLLHRLDPASPAYHVPAAVEISGQLDGRRLRQALAAVVARQTALRTRIVDTESGPAQVIDDSRFDAIGFDAIGFDDYGSDEGVLPLACVDLSSLPSELALAAAEGEARRFITLPFDLAAAPPWRGALYRFAPRRHLLVLSIHHVATDGWSMGILFSDLLAAYAGSALAPLPLEVIDHAAWQRQVLEGDVLETRLERWSQRLDGAPRLLEMPTDRPRPARLDDAGGRVAVGLAPALARRLRRFAEGRSTTPFVTLLALWQALLSRWTSHSDLPIGVPMTAREAPELESVVGPFIDTLVLRGDLRGDPSLEELVARGQRDALDAFSLRDLPFERLVDELEVERSLSHTPLFQVMFAFHDLPAAELSSGPLELRRWSLDTGAVQSDLGLVLAPEGEGIGGVLEYRSALFDEVTVERLAAAFQRLSAALLEQPRRPLSRAPLLSAAERSTVLEEWSGAGGPQTEPLPLVATVLDHARRYPAATAVVDLETGVELSYGDLAVRVMALTAELRSAGVRGEDRVAVLAHRSPALVVSLLAVLAVGAAFVPLDPGLPRRRRDEILTLAGCRHALAVAQTGDDTGEGAEVDLPVPTILVPRDALSPTANEPPVELPVELPDPQWPTVHPQNAAYVLFTSGSSGQPKGVVVSIIALERFLTGAQQLYGVSFSDRVLQMASPAFDTSIEEIFLTLRAGASLALRSADTLASPRRFFELCDDHGVTVLDLPTAWWHELAAAMEDGDLRAPTAVRLVILGGEEARAEVLPAWHRGTESGLRLINTYGPTETTVAVVASEGFAPETLRIPLGRPYEGIRALVLDRHLGPVLPGAAGELCIGGGTLARGYLGQPARTAEVFVPDPYGSRPGARLYRTGDRVRFATDGQLEFFGRLDRQVKLRGFRVEPGEVEAALLGCRGVGGAAVAVLDGPAGLALAAWVVADRSLEEIAAELGERVPSYQQPTLWAAVERLETTLTGKIDRRRMVAPSPLTVGSSFPVGGASPEEEGLAALWQQVLGVETVGAGDDFFALGGHSLAAARLIPRIREIFGVEMPLSDLFEAPTLRLQAERLGERMRSPLRPEPPPLEPAKQRHFLSFSQERLWFLDRLDPGSPAFGMPSALRLEGPVDPRALRAAWSALATRHEALRTCYPEVAGVPRAQLLPAPAPQSWPVVDLSGLAPSTAQEVAKGLASAERAYRFDLASAAPLRVLLLRHGPERWDLLVNVHHIAADGGSISILLDELQRLYVDLAAGREPSLPPPELQYADFAAWERRWLEDGGALPPLLELWRSRLGGDLPRVALPYDQSPSGESAPSRSGGLATLELGVEELRALHAAAGEGTTLYIALLSAFQLYLAALTGQRDQRVGTPVEVRPARALEGVVGMFTNTLVLRTDLGDDPDYDPDFGDVVERVRRTAVDAWALRELPYDRLLAALRADRDPRHAPLYEVWFVLQDEDPGLQVPGIRATPLPTDAGPTKFNLAANLSVTDKGLRGVLEYDRELFTAATGRRLAAGFQSVLEALARNPKIRLSTLTQQLAQRDEAAESAGRRRFEAHLKDRLGALRPGRRRGGFSPSSRKDPDS